MALEIFYGFYYKIRNYILMYIIILGIVFIHLGGILQQFIEDLLQSPETISTL